MRRKKHQAYLTEKESNNLLSIFRVKSNLPVKKLARLCGISGSIVSGLESGDIEPYYKKGDKKGEIKPFIYRICKELEVDFDTLFPENKDNLLESILNDFYNLQEQETPEELLIKKEERLILKEALRILSKKERDFFIKKFAKNMTLREIGKSYSYSRERIRQINKETSIILREYINKRNIINYS